MRVQQTLRRNRVRLERAGAWRAQSSAENQLFDACCDVLESARRLERAAGVPGSSGAILPAAGCLSAAFEALANAGLMMGSATTEAGPSAAEARHSELRARLLGATVNLQLASRACELRERED